MSQSTRYVLCVLVGGALGAYGATLYIMRGMQRSLDEAFGY